MAYAALEPFGESRADYRAGVLASVMANMNRSDENDPTFAPDDFFPNLAADEDGDDTDGWQRIKSAMNGMVSE